MKAAEIVSIVMGAVTVVLLLFVLYLLRTVYGLVRRDAKAREATQQTLEQREQPPPKASKP